MGLETQETCKMTKLKQLSLAQALNLEKEKKVSSTVIEPEKLIGLKVDFKTIRRNSKGCRPRIEIKQGIVVQPANVPGYVVVGGIEGGTFNRSISDLEVRP